MRWLLWLMFAITCIPTFSRSFLKIIYVSSQTPECDTLHTCLFIKDSPDQEWRSFQQPIEGFQYTPGYEYCLLVEVSKVNSNPPVPFDTVHLQYKLTEIRSKVNKLVASDVSGDIQNVDTVKWMLYKLKTKDGT